MTSKFACAARLATALVLGGCSSPGHDAAGAARDSGAALGTPRPAPAAAAAAAPAAVTAVTAVTVGQEHSCALKASGAASCWGSNESRQLGSGNDSSALAPVPVAGSHHFVAISAGAGHTCALDENGAAWCWGTGEQGQLGTGRPSDSSAAPVPVRTDHHFVAISASVSHSCALERAGTAWCWGANESGQLGAGSSSASPVPVAVQGHSYRAIAAGPSYTCAATTSGSVECWGVSTLGGGGDAPAPVAGLQDIVALSAGANVACAVDSRGGVWCWGANDFGQLGAGRIDRRDAPVRTPLRVALSATAASVSVGGGRSCAVAVDGALSCWGIDDDHALGATTSTVCPIDGRTVACAPQPLAVTPSLHFARVAVGQYHSCSSTTDGRVYCWGTSMNGNLGSGSDSDVAEPREVRLP